MKTLLCVGAAALLTIAPASAQTIVSNHPPLSPDEAVSVLSGSHSIADLTDYRSPGTGPTVVVMGESTTPWSWPAAAYTPPQPLSREPFYAPHYAPRYTPRYNPHYSPHYESTFVVASRGHRDVERRDDVVRPVSARRVLTPGPHLEGAPARAAGRVVRR